MLKIASGWPAAGREWGLRWGAEEGPDAFPRGIWWDSGRVSSTGTPGLAQAGLSLCLLGPDETKFSIWVRLCVTWHSKTASINILGNQLQVASFPCTDQYSRVPNNHIAQIKVSQGKMTKN